ncbi:Ger(x)C family spore germination protein [Neobacillus niacini]|uniref:Ger(x)C family spore germination protein n=1 Tax=Neobacillus niacini TaxID=86668 RepID=UPI0005ED93B5|nr:Ger(x)C family spore germination protein [Neobacillus niacini]
MKRWVLALVSILLIFLLSSCGGRAPLEDLTLAFILGVDLDDENNLTFYELNPVFHKGSKKGLEAYEVRAKTIRDSRRIFDGLTTGEVVAGKIQVLLVGERVLEHAGWFSILDSVYRNPNFSMNTRVVAVKGPVSDVVFYNPGEKPELSLHLKAVIDKSYDRTRAVKGTLQELHREVYEKGMTPIISEVKKEKKLELSGMALLYNKGKYAASLDVPESTLLLVLKNEKRHEVTMTIPIFPIEKENNIFHKNELSFQASRVKTKIKTGYKKNAFHFDVKVNMTVNIMERIFPEDKVKKAELVKLIEKELQKQFTDLIKKIQKKKIDPIGFGLYARAYHYEQFKKVDNDWGKALAESDINVSVNVKVNAYGAVK